MNSGVYWEEARNTIVYAVFNTTSGFWHQFGMGAGNGGMPGNYNNDLARAMGTPSWAKVTKSHANVLRAACEQVRMFK